MEREQGDHFESIRTAPQPTFAPRENDATTLAFRAPNPNVIKRGRNVDAGQPAGNYTDPLYGHNNDDVIWRIQIQNTGLAAMQDVRLDDLMAAGNLVISQACPTEASRHHDR